MFLTVHIIPLKLNYRCFFVPLLCQQLQTGAWISWPCCMFDVTPCPSAWTPTVYCNVLGFVICNIWMDRCATAYILLAEEEATTIAEAEKLFKQALKAGDGCYRRSQQLQHHGSQYEAQHSKVSSRVLCWGIGMGELIRPQVQSGSEPASPGFC